MIAILSAGLTLAVFASMGFYYLRQENREKRDAATKPR